VSRRRLLLGVLAGIAALLLGSVLFALWLINSGGGRDLVLARLILLLQPAEVRIERAEGPLRGPLTLHGVDYVDPDGLEVRAERLLLDYDLRALLGRHVHLRRLHADGVRVRLPPLDPEAEPVPFRLPEQLPWLDVELPVALTVDDLRLRELGVERADETLFVAATLDAGLHWARGERLLLERFELDADIGRLAADGEIGLDGRAHARLAARWQPPGAASALPIAVEPAAGGLRLQVEVPDSGELQLELDHDLGWRLHVALQGFRPQRWFPDADPEPLDLALAAVGRREAFELEGSLQRAGRTLLIEPSRLALDDEVTRLQLAPLVLVLDDGGRAVAEGSVVLGPPLAFDVAVEAAQLQLPLGDEDAARFDGRLVARGPLDALALELDGTLQRADLQGTIALQGLLGEQAFAIERIELRHGAGRLLGRGEVDWAAAPQWQFDAELHDFDPGVLSAQLAGRIDGRLRSEGRLGDDGLVARLDIDALRGTLRDRPLTAQGRIELAPGGRSADLSANLGDSRLRVQSVPGRGDELQITLSPLQLADVLPDAAGEVAGTLRLRGLDADARLAGRLSGSGLRWQDERVAAFELELDTPLDFGTGAKIRLQARELTLRGEPLERLRLDVDGGFDGLRVDADLEGPRLALDGRWQGRRDAAGVWTGQLDALRLRSGDMPTLSLQAPGTLRFGEGVLELGEHCLAAERGSLCASVRQAGAEQQLTLRIAELPLALLEPWISSPDRPLSVSGTLEGGGELLLVDGEPRQADITLRSAQGGMSWQLDAGPQPLVEWSGLVIAIELQEGRLGLRADAVLDGDGRLQARLAGPSPFTDPDGAVGGRIEIELPQLGLLNLLPAAVVGPQGRLDAGVDLGGRWNRPGIDGRIQLSRFTAEIPMLGLSLAESTLTLTGDGERIAIEGLLQPGGGALRIDGVAESLVDAPALRLNIVGEDVQVADTPLVTAVASPDLQAAFVDGRLELRGRLAIPSASLDLERIDNTVAASDDVVVMDPRESREDERELPIDADLEVVLGDRVLLKGFGFDGGIAGTVQVRERPGRPTTGRGSLTVRGDYTAYGQNLSIERGRLNYASSPLDDPRLDLRVGRTIASTRVGLDVLGSARDPSLTVWSDPAMDQGEALSWLLLGRPLRAAGAGDSEQLTEAALAVGGNLLAARLGARMGFDTFEVANSESLGGAALTVGKFLSPRLHISYGVSLFGSGQVLNLKYLLTERFEVELESGDESRAALNYRVER
jgi:translocation and assembly module TamB